MREECSCGVRQFSIQCLTNTIALRRHGGELRDAAPRQVPARPGVLKVESTGESVHIEDFSGEKQVWPEFGLGWQEPMSHEVGAFLFKGMLALHCVLI